MEFNQGYRLNNGEQIIVLKEFHHYHSDQTDFLIKTANNQNYIISRSERRIQKLCEENRIDGTEKFGRAWMIPKDAEKPVDGRMKTRNKQEENHGI